MQLDRRMQRVPSRGRFSQRSFLFPAGEKNFGRWIPVGPVVAGSCQGSMTCRVRLRSFNCPPVDLRTCSGRWDGMCES